MSTKTYKGPLELAAKAVGINIDFNITTTDGFLVWYGTDKWNPFDDNGVSCVTAVV